MKAIKGLRGGLAGALTRSRGPAMDLDWPNGSCYTSFFTDLMKQTGGFVQPSGSSVDANGWPTGVSAGQSITFFLWTGVSTPGAAFRPGTYKARMDAAHIAAGWTCQFVDARASGITVISAAGGTCTVTVTDLGTDGDYSGLTLNVTAFAPGSGGPYNLTGFQIYKQANEAWLDGGNYYNIFDPDFLNDMTGIRSIRVKDWLGTDIAALNAPDGSGHFYRTRMGPTRAADMTAESNRTWQMPTAAQFVNQGSTRVQWGGNVPFSVCAKLARYLGCTLMMTFPMMIDMASYDAFAATDIFQCYGHDFQDGDTVILSSVVPTVSGVALANWTPYFIRDTVPGVSWKLARTLGGAAIDVTADSFRSDLYDQLAWKLYTEAQTQAFYNAIALELFTAAPGIDIISDVGNEVWNPAAGIYGFHQAYECLTMQTANRNAGSGYAWSLMRAWKAIETYYPRSQHIRMLSGQTPFFAALGPDGYNYVDPTLYDGAKVADLIDAHCNATYVYCSFKPGINNAGLSATGNDFQPNWVAVAGSDWYSAEAYVPGDVVHMTTGINYTCILSHTNQVPPNVTYWTATSTDTLTGSGTTWSNDQMLAFGLRCNANAAYYSGTYRAAGDALRTNPVPAGYVAYEGGQLWGNAPVIAVAGGQLTFTTQMGAFMKTAQFQSWMQDYVSTVLKSNGYTTPHHYIGAGQWRFVSESNAVVYGIKRAHHLPDTPASAYYKTAVL